MGTCVYVAGGLGSMGYTILSTIEKLDVKYHKHEWQVINAPYEHSIHPTSAPLMISLHHRNKILLLGGVGLYDIGYLFSARTERSVEVMAENSHEIQAWGNQNAIVLGFRERKAQVIGLALDSSSCRLKLVSYVTSRQQFRVL